MKKDAIIESGMERCGWGTGEPIYEAYHDTEWGARTGHRALWEKLILDGFQAGLSWITILKKRDNFRAAFARFDPHIVASWNEAEVTACIANPGIAHHRGKIAATITNARGRQEIEAREGFDQFYGNTSMGCRCKTVGSRGARCQRRRICRGRSRNI